MTMASRRTVSVAAAAARLTVSQATVRNWVAAGVLGADRGPQPKRPRLAIWVNKQGQPLTPQGRVVASAVARAASLADLEARLAAVEERVVDISVHGVTGEPFRDAALQLQQAMERQRRALDLQLRAFQELNGAVSEQANVIAGLLVGDPAAQL
ncbi:MAG: hypothetical protein QOK28_3379 [Actinomycetota bacterium]|jgi:hypothetical protein